MAIVIKLISLKPTNFAKSREKISPMDCENDQIGKTMFAIETVSPLSFLLP